MSDPMSDLSPGAEFAQWLVDVLYLNWLIDECGYRHPKPIDGRRWAAIQPLAFTHRIAVGRLGDIVGVEDGWCYQTYDQAKAALDAWDGQGEPAGWHRHPESGRRVALTDDENDADGNVIAKGTMYRRG